MTETKRDRYIRILSELTDTGATLTANATVQVLELLKEPVMDAVPERHGRWQYHINASNEVNTEDAYCSKCGFYVDVTTAFNFNKYLYCPYCGTRMDGKDGHEKAD